MKSVFSFLKKINGNKDSQFIAQSNFIYIASSPIHGRGVFTNRNIKTGEVIERCPIIKTKLEEMIIRNDMVLNYYAFMIDESKEYAGIVLGYGSLYNHADDNNTLFYYDKATELMIFEAVRKIVKYEEITINYLGDNSAGLSIDNWSTKPKL